MSTVTAPPLRNLFPYFAHTFLPSHCSFTSKQVFQVQRGNGGSLFNSEAMSVVDGSEVGVYVRVMRKRVNAPTLYTSPLTPHNLAINVGGARFYVYKEVGSWQSLRGSIGSFKFGMGFPAPHGHLPLLRREAEASCNDPAETSAYRCGRGGDAG